MSKKEFLIRATSSKFYSSFKNWTTLVLSSLKQKKYLEFQKKKDSGFSFGFSSFQEWHINVWQGAMKLQAILLEHQQLSNDLSVSFCQYCFFSFKKKGKTYRKAPQQKKILFDLSFFWKILFSYRIYLYFRNWFECRICRWCGRAS